MELFQGRDALPFDVTTSIVAAITGLVTIWVVYRLLRSDPDKPVNFSVPAPEQCAPDWAGKALENPSIRVSSSTAIQCYAPATGYFLGLVNPTTPDGIDRIISTAEAAQARWRETTFVQRRRVLKTLLKFVLDNQETIARVACLDSGKTRIDAIFGELLVTAEKLQWTIDHGEKALKSERRPTNRMMFYKKNEVRYEPLGVVAACVSWKCVKSTIHHKHSH
jgi:acyl-CoA reductase-like NAD-dependent aldehyde dehydrogenase